MNGVPVRYRVTVAGHGDERRLGEYLEATVIERRGDSTTIETEVRDGAELLGVLTRLSDVGLMPTEATIAGSPAGLRVERTAGRVRAFVGGATVIDSVDAVVLCTPGTAPQYAVGEADVDFSAFAPSATTRIDAQRGTSRHWHLLVGDGRRADALAAWDAPELDGLFVLRFDAADRWFEEDDPVLFGPRDPRHRVDVLESSRRVRYELDGVVLAETDRPRLVLETGIPERWYVPLVDLDFGPLEPSSTRTICPYKGAASYWSATVDREAYPDLVWAYQEPTAQAAKLAGFACLPAERVDCYVDGTRQPPLAKNEGRPRSLRG